MNKLEWEQFKTLLQKIGIKPYVMESKNGQGELLGYVVRLNVDNVKFKVDVTKEEFQKPLSEVVGSELKSVSVKRGRPKKV